MRISDILTICFRNLIRRKLRTFLTALGVVIGVALIIVAVSIGIGLSVTYDEQMASWGDLTVINVYNWNSQVTMDDAAVAQIQALDGVDIATPFYQNWELSFQMKTKNGRYLCFPQLYGVYPEALEKLGYQLKEGKYLEERDKEYSMVVGEQFAYRFYDTKKKRNNRVDPYPDQYGRIHDPYVDIMKDKLILYLPSQKTDANGNPIGKDLEVKPVIAGVLLKDDTSWEATNAAFMDINEMRALEQKYNKQNGIKKTGDSKKINYEDVRVKCADVDSVSAVQEAIRAMGVTIEDTAGEFVGASSMEEQIRALFAPGGLQNGGGTGEEQDHGDGGNAVQGGQNAPGEGENGQGGGTSAMLTGHLDLAKLERMKKEDLLDLAAKLGVDVSAAKNQRERAQLIAAAEVQATANPQENDGGAQ